MVTAAFSASVDGANSQSNQSYYEFSLAFKIKILETHFNIHLNTISNIYVKNK